MKSMTAYAYVTKKSNSQLLNLILRSTNFKYLDISIHNLPTEHIFLEEKIKKQIKKLINRGKIEVFIFFRKQNARTVKIDENSLGNYIRQTRKLAKKFNLTYNLDIGQFLSLPNVVQYEEKHTGETDIILSAVKEGLQSLLRFKKNEGKAIAREMLKNLKSLKKNGEHIMNKSPHANNSENNKEAIEEETALISFYSIMLEKKIHSNDSEPKGKSIDFLTQELLRELNAASSKTKDKTLATLIVESKNYLERIREQAQNVE
ncbi:MAG: DUF1732 domain-containing protein [Candidatus Omnitrophota bacterium]